MASYQHDASKGEYETIKNGDDSMVASGNSSSTKKKWLITGLVLVVLAMFVFRQPAGASTTDAIKKSDIPLNEDGSVKLFDKLSKLLMA